MESRSQNYPRTTDEVFMDFKGRRAAFIKALTNDFGDFYKQCDPEKANLCLYGFPNEEWEVDLPAEEVPPELPEPTLGINFARDGMRIKDWTSLVAASSDSWLISVAFFFGARFRFDKDEREKLFNMINELPTVLEAVDAFSAKEEAKKKRSLNPNLSNNKSGNKYSKGTPHDNDKECMKDDPEEEEEEEEDEDEDGDVSCEACGKIDTSNEIWVCCNVCEAWSHAKCMKITPAIAQYNNKECNNCSSCIYKGDLSKLESKYEDLPWQQRTISCWKLLSKCLLG